MSYDYSAVCVVPASHQEIGNQLAEGLGHGPGNYSVPLSFDGLDPPSHFGCRAQVNEFFVQIVQSAGIGEFPEIEGMSQAEVYQAFSAMSIDIQQSPDPYTHFVEYIGSLGLQMISGE